MPHPLVRRVVLKNMGEALMSSMTCCTSVNISEMRVLIVSLHKDTSKIFFALALAKINFPPSMRKPLQAFLQWYGFFRIAIGNATSKKVTTLAVLCC